MSYSNEYPVRYDADNYARLKHLAELMQQFPDRKMKRLQQSALREYPVHSRELYRHCMSWRYAMRAADILNIPLMEALKPSRK